MTKAKKKVWLVGHKDSAKKKDYLAVSNLKAEAERLMAIMPTATFVKEVTYESR